MIRSIKRTFPGATTTNRAWMLERFKGESFVAMMQTVIVQLALQIVIQKKLPLRLGLGLLVPNEVVPTPMFEAQFEFLYPPNSIII